MPNVRNQIRTVEVDAITLSDVLKDVPCVDFLKIDIEGGEYHAFLGMMQLLEQKRIKLVSFEWNKIMLGSDAPLFLDLLRELEQQHGARFFALNNEGDMLPVTLEAITSLDFYPFVIMSY